MKKNLLPFLIFLAFALLMGLALLKGGKDPAAASSALIGKPAPAFSLDGFSDRDLRMGKMSIVNFFASWCTPCAAEQPLLQEIAARGDVSVYGIAYKDKVEETEKWLKKEGNPFRAVGHDARGQTAIDWGVYGVPETFIISGGGIIIHRHVGPLTKEVLEKDFLPILEREK